MGKSIMYDDILYKSEDIRKMFAALISSGVLGVSATNLQVVANTGMTIKAKAGRAWTNGGCYVTDTDEGLTVPTADGVLHRIDRVVLREDLTYINGQQVGHKLMIVPGTLSDHPVAPALVRDGTYYDIGLATIKVDAGTTAITQDLITDTRPDGNICGMVYSMARDSDMSGIYAQMEAQLLKVLQALGNDDHVTVEIAEKKQGNLSDMLKLI